MDYLSHKEYFFHGDPKARVLDLDLVAMGKNWYAGPERSSVKVAAAEFAHYSLMYLVSGRGRLRLIDRSHPMAAESVIVFYPGERRPPSRWSADYCEYWITFEGGLVERNAELVPRVPLELPPDNDLGPRIVEMHEAAAEPGCQGRQLVYKLYHLLGLLAEAAEGAPSLAAKADPVQQVIALVSKQCEVNWNFEQLAEERGISYSHLRHQIREQTGMPPHQWLINLRVNQACRLLRQGRLVKETSYLVGFSTPHHFSRLFRRTIGVTPSEFSEQSRQ